MSPKVCKCMLQHPFSSSRTTRFGDTISNLTFFIEKEEYKNNNNNNVFYSTTVKL